MAPIVAPGAYLTLVAPCARARAVFERATEYAYSSERADDKIGYQEEPENLFVYPSACCWQKECLGMCQHTVGADDGGCDEFPAADKPAADGPDRAFLLTLTVTIAGGSVVGAPREPQLPRGSVGAGVAPGEPEGKPDDGGAEEHAALLLHSIGANPFFSANDFTEMADQQEYSDDDGSDNGGSGDSDHDGCSSDGSDDGDEHSAHGDAMGQPVITVSVFTLECGGYDEDDEHGAAGDEDDCGFVFESDDHGGLHGDGFVDYMEDEEEEESEEDSDDGGSDGDDASDGGAPDQQPDRRVAAEQQH